MAGGRMADGRDGTGSSSGHISGGFSNLVALLALAISLASAGWSVFAFWKSSEIRPLAFEEVSFLNDKDVAQIQIEITIANLAYGDYDDVARVEEMTLQNGDRRLRFIARNTASVRPFPPGPDNSYPTLEHPCRWGGVGLEVCTRSDSPVVALPAGEVVIHYPLFELAYEDCGLDDCSFITHAQLSEFLQGEVRATYTVTTMRDGLHSVSCTLKTDAEQAAYYASVGWFSSACENVS